jgi:hypothetical protein
MRRLSRLSGVAFGLLVLFAWFLSGGDAPDFTATDEVWIGWSDANSQASRIGGFLILLAGLALLHFAASIRSVLGIAESRVRGSVDMARIAFAGAVVGGAGLAMAIVTVSSAIETAGANLVVTRAVQAAAAGPYLVSAMGFCALLGAAGLSTLRSRALPRLTAIVALIGAIAFLVTFLTVIAGLGKDSVFGLGFLPVILALVIWSIATSIATFRDLAPTP